MKYAVGYYAQDELERPFLYGLNKFRDKIVEVYFPWPSMHTCRSMEWNGYAFDNLLESLSFAAENDIRLDLLMNANCYGGSAISKELEQNVVCTVEDILLRVGKLDSVTTTSPAIAHIMKKHFFGIKVRASVNMQLRNEECLQPLIGKFDEFYLPRELNYDFIAIRRWKEILGKHPLYLLANSGCMAWCPGQIFHDNMVAHEDEIARTRNIEGFMPYVCWTWYKSHPENVLKKSTWIRPEDIHFYDHEFSMAKLATRINPKPYRVLKAYCAEHFGGNILNIMEPDHSSVIGKGMLDNTAFPNNFFELKSTGMLNDLEETFSKIFLKYEQ